MKELKKNRKTYLHIAVFITVFLFLFVKINDIFSTKTSYLFYRSVKEEDPLDCIFIGSSTTYTMVNPMFIYHNYGIRSVNFCSPSLYLGAYKTSLEIASEGHEDALFVLGINNFKAEADLPSIHFLTDNVPFSLRMISLLRNISESHQLTFSDRLAYYMPIIEFHERWDSLIPNDFTVSYNHYRGTVSTESYLSVSYDNTGKHQLTDKAGVLEEDTKAIVDDLISYIEENHLKVLFVLPVKMSNEEEMMTENAFAQYVRSLGYDCLNLQEKTEEIGLDLSKDLYDLKHCNIHGAVKYSDYLAQYLLKEHNVSYDSNYKNNTEEKDYYDKYKLMVSAYFLDEEDDMKHRDYFLEGPQLKSLKEKDGKIVLTYDPVKEADGYVIYRKEVSAGTEEIAEDGTVSVFVKVDDKNRPYGWTKISETKGTSFTDDDYRSDKTYAYTVIAYRETNGEKIYGLYDYQGLSIKTKGTEK